MKGFSSPDEWKPLKQKLESHVPGVEFYTYDAEHAFTNKSGDNYHKQHAELAFSRMFQFFNKHLSWAIQHPCWSDADPPENCHLNVKKSSTKLTFKKKKIDKNFHFFEKNCKIFSFFSKKLRNFFEKKMTIFGNFFEKMSRFWQFFWTVKWQFSVRSGSKGKI